MDERDTRLDVRLKTALESSRLPSELLVCGPAGSGKTYPIVATLHALAADYRGLRILILRQTRASLTDSVLVTFEQEILPADGMEWLASGVRRRNRSSYVYPNGSEIVIGGLDRPDRVLSTSWDLIYVNEATEIDEEAWETLTSRKARPGRPRRIAKILADCNPASPSHWLKRRSDEGVTTLWEATHRSNPRMWDGGGWTEEGEFYLESLRQSLRGSRRLRLLEGLWATGEGAWFDGFGKDHIDESATYDPSLPVHLAIDSGVYTGAVAFQVRPSFDGQSSVTVFYDGLYEGWTAFDVATDIMIRLGGRVGTRLIVTTDPAGGSRNPIGPSVLAEYARAGLRCSPWPTGRVADGLALLEALLGPPIRLRLHPECKATIDALANYRRKRRAGQWTDEPEDPQHPAEDMVDALRGGLKAALPAGLAPAPKFARRSIARVSY